MDEEPAASETVAQVVSGDDKKARILKEFFARIGGWLQALENGAQLLFTTHDAMLLDLSFFRRDQIWFAEKNEKTSATELYSLASFSPRKGENVRKGYLQGRFGAIPFIGGDGQWQR